MRWLGISLRLHVFSCALCIIRGWLCVLALDVFFLLKMCIDVSWSRLTYGRTVRSLSAIDTQEPTSLNTRAMPQERIQHLPHISHTSFVVVGHRYGWNIQAWAYMFCQADKVFIFVVDFAFTTDAWFHRVFVVVNNLLELGWKEMKSFKTT